MSILYPVVRTDSWPLLILNLVGFVGFVAVAGLWIWSYRSGRKAQLRDILILISLTVFGVYVPAFPIAWVVMEREDNQMADGTVRLPFM